MRIGTDNSTIHAVGRCLSGSAGNESDVLSFLQFAGVLIFCDEVHISSTELDWVVERSTEVCAQLGRIGIDTSFVRRKIDKAHYDAACIAIADELVFDMKFSFDAFLSIFEERLSTQSTLDLQHVHESSRPLHELIESRCPDTKRSEILDKATGTDVSLMPEHAVVSNDQLVEVLREYVTRAGWSADKTAAFDLIARFRYNTAIYSDRTITPMKTAYLPHASRGQIFYNAHLVATAAIDRILEGGREKLGQHRDLVNTKDLPLLADSLIVLGRADPVGILREVARLRALSEHVRKVLSQIPPNPADQVAALAEFEHAVKSNYSGCADTARFRPVANVIVGMLMKVTGVDPTELLDAYRRKRMTKRATLFSELIGAGSSTFEDPTRYQRLSARCMKNCEIEK